MQAYNNGENWTNEMEKMLASDVPLDPDWGFGGGAEVGTVWEIPVRVNTHAPVLAEALQSNRFTESAFDPQPRLGHPDQEPFAHTNNKGSDIWQDGDFDNQSPARANNEDDQWQLVFPQHQNLQPTDTSYLGPPQLLGSESLDLQDFSDALNVGNNDVDSSMWPSNGMGNAGLPEHVMGSGLVLAPSFNTGFPTQLQYPADSGQWMMNPTSYSTVPSTFNPLLFTGYLNAPNQVTSQAQATVSASVVAQVATSFACTQAGCPATFSRDADRTRHEASKHSINGRRYFCHVHGCPKSHGVGYKRMDKLTEHRWRKHPEMGFAKRVS